MKNRLDDIETPQKTDLLSLPLDERVRVCHEIHNALQAKVAGAKIPLSPNVLIAKETMPDTEIEPLHEKPTLGEIDPNNALIINNLLKRLW